MTRTQDKVLAAEVQARGHGKSYRQLVRAEKPTELKQDAKFDHEPTLAEIIYHPQFAQQVHNIVVNINNMYDTARRSGVKPNRSPFTTLAEKGVLLDVVHSDSVTELAVQIYTKTCKDLSSTERRWLKRLFDVAGNKVCEIIAKEKSNK